VRLTRLSLSHFRNFARLTLNFDQPITLLQGDNGQGKTNLLEAIYYLATSRSPRASVEQEVVNWLAYDEPLPYARLEGDVLSGSDRHRIEITLVQRQNQNNGSRRFSKQIRIDGVDRRALDLLGRLPVVLFLPEDIALVTGAPSVRRRYLRAVLCQVDSAHCRDLSEMDRVLTQRNALLKDLRERGGSNAEDRLRYWDEQLVALGTRVTLRRAALLSALEQEAGPQHQQLTSSLERLRLVYRSRVLECALDDQLPLNNGNHAGRTLNGPVDELPDADTLSEYYAQGLKGVRPREIAAGVTLLGPHRDDVVFVDEGRDLRSYGSRGQQRTAALSLKLAEVAVMDQELGQPPLLLLDDVMSELDATRRDALTGLLHAVSQAVVTTTDWDDFACDLQDSAQCWRVVDGRLLARNGGQAATSLPEPDSAL